MTDKKNIIEAILEYRKKYIVLISGIIWWDIIRKLIYFIAKTLNFEIIILESKVFPKKISDIEFIKLSSKIKNKLETNKANSNYKGFLVVGLTFPTNLIDIPVDLHINITTDSILSNKLLLALQKAKNIKRLELEESTNFINNTYKDNKINKYYKLNDNYMNEMNNIYQQICNLIFTNIEKKLYGDSYLEYKSNEIEYDKSIDSDLNNIEYEKNEDVIELTNKYIDRTLNNPIKFRLGKHNNT